MMKGRFLDFAPNTGDAFCFLIITVPEEPSDTPCVLARSIIRSRSTPKGIEELSLILNINERTKSVEFYANDSLTVTKSSGTENKALDDTLDCMVNEAEIQDHMTMCSEVTNTNGSDSSDPFANGFLEVYGTSLSTNEDNADIQEMASEGYNTQCEIKDGMVTNYLDENSDNLADYNEVTRLEEHDVVVTMEDNHDNSFEPIECGIVTQETDEEPDVMKYHITWSY
jgi:hypothetical protein